MDLFSQALLSMGMLRQYGYVSLLVVALKVKKTSPARNRGLPKKTEYRKDTSPLTHCTQHASNTAHTADA